MAIRNKSSHLPEIGAWTRIRLRQHNQPFSNLAGADFRTGSTRRGMSNKLLRGPGPWARGRMTHLLKLVHKILLYGRVLLDVHTERGKDESHEQFV